MTQRSTPRKGRAVAGTAMVSAPLMLAAMLGQSAPAEAAITPQATPEPAPAEESKTTGWTRGTTPGTVKTKAPGTRAYEVRPGDSLFKIARTHDVKVSEILRLNDMPDNAVLRPGQAISLPERRREAERPGSTHRVQAGETLGGIAERFGTTTEALQKANAMGSSQIISEGEVLKLSGTGATSGREVAETGDDLPHLPRSFKGREYPAETVRAARTNKKILLESSLPSRAEMKVKISQTATRMGVSPALALAVAQQESGFNMAVVSPANAVGTMQVIPSSGRWAQSLVGKRLNLLDPDDNVTAGIAILRALTRAGDSESQAIAGYYQGLGSVRENGMYDDTRKYVRSIQVLKSRFGTAPKRVGSEST